MKSQVFGNCIVVTTTLAKIMWTTNCSSANNGNFKIDTLFHEFCPPPRPYSMLFAAFKF